MKSPILPILLLLISSLPLHADTFRGRVADADGSPLPGAVVAAQGGGAVMTDGNGQFTLTVPDRHALRVQVTCTGFEPLSGVVRSDRDVKGNTLRLVADHTALTEVVVTATRTPKALKDVPVTTRVISGSEIERADATNVQNLLAGELPGVEFGQAMSQETTLNMGGFGGNAVLFLVDGERLAGETMDNVDYSRLNLDDVGRVEIVKGASSALYGANAVGGVVNLISRDSREPFTASVNTRYGSAGHDLRTGARVTLRRGAVSSSTSAQHRHSDAVRLTSPFDTDSRLHYIYGGSSLNLRERMSISVSERVDITARGSYFDRYSDRLTYTDRYRDWSGGVRGEWRPESGGALEMAYGYDRYDKARYVGGQLTDLHDYSNRQHTLHALYTRPIGANGLTLGADFTADRLATYQFTDGEHRQTSADAFAQVDWNPCRRFNLVGSVRYDHFSASRLNAVTARVAMLFKLKPFTLRAGYSDGFRAPSLKEMYMNFDMAGIQMIYGNPDLKPERSNNFNIALERNGSVGRNTYSLTLAANHSHYDNRITTTDFPGSADREPGAVYVNERGVKVSGIDFTGRYRTHFGLGLTASYAYLHMAGRIIDSQFSQPRPHSATWRVDYELRPCSDYGLYAALTGRWLSAPFSKYETGGAYSLTSFTLRQSLPLGLGLNFGIDNLLNYRPRIYYWNSPPTPGRTFTLGLTWKINE